MKQQILEQQLESAKTAAIAMEAAAEVLLSFVQSLLKAAGLSAAEQNGALAVLKKRSAALAIERLKALDEEPSDNEGPSGAVH